MLAVQWLYIRNLYTGCAVHAADGSALCSLRPCSSFAACITSGACTARAAGASCIHPLLPVQPVLPVRPVQPVQ